MPSTQLPRLAAAVLILGLAALSAGRAVALDLEPIAIEVTQSVQDLANSIPLYERKKTAVRVHVRVTGASEVGNVRARLTVLEQLSPPPFPVTFPLGVLTPVEEPLVVRDAPDRGVLEDSFLFELPAGWTLRGNPIELRATVDAGDRIAESNEANNGLTETVSFVPAERLLLRFYALTTPLTGPPPVFDVFKLFAWLNAAYPMPGFSLRAARELPFDVDLASAGCSCTRDAEGRCASIGSCTNDGTRSCWDNTDCGCGRVDRMLDTMTRLDYLLSTASRSLLRTRSYGMLSDAGGFMRGCTIGIPGLASSGPTGSASYGWDFDGSYGDWYGGHEVAHSTGRVHSNCCGAVEGVSAPYPSCRLSPLDDSIYGFDTALREVYEPSGSDFMSYCDDQWIPDYNYTGLQADLAAEAALGDPGIGGLAARVLVTARMRVDLGVGDLGPMFKVDSYRPAIQGAPTDWEIRFSSAQQQLLAVHPFTPLELVSEAALLPPGEPDAGAGAPMAYAMEILPYAPGTAIVQLVHAGNVLDERIVSASPPSVTLLSPNGGALLGSSAAVEWTSFDQDGDPLTAYLLHSPDGGVTWSTLLAELPASGSVMVPLDGVPGGSDGLLAVLVSDGFHTAFDTSDDKVILANNAPVAFVLTPQEGTLYRYDQHLVLDAFAQDAENGDLGDADVSWSSDVDGFLGTGLSLYVTSLSPGTHVITMYAQDADGGVTTDTVTVQVAVPPQVPSTSWWGALLLAAGLAVGGWAAASWRRLSKTESSAPSARPSRR